MHKFGEEEKRTGLGASNPTDVSGSALHLQEIARKQPMEMEYDDPPATFGDVATAGLDLEEKILAASLQGWSASQTSISIAFGFAASATVVALTAFASSAASVMTSDKLTATARQEAGAWLNVGWCGGLMFLVVGAVGCLVALQRQGIEWPDAEGLEANQLDRPFGSVELIRQQAKLSRVVASQIERATEKRLKLLGASILLLILSVATSLFSLAMVQRQQFAMPQSNVSEQKKETSTPKSEPAAPKEPAPKVPAKENPLKRPLRETTGRQVRLSEDGGGIRKDGAKKPPEGH